MVSTFNFRSQVLCLYPAGGEIQLTTLWCFIAQSLPSSQYDLNYVERDGKHLIIIIIISVIINNR